MHFSDPIRKQCGHVCQVLPLHGGRRGKASAGAGGTWKAMAIVIGAQARRIPAWHLPNEAKE